MKRFRRYLLAVLTVCVAAAPGVAAEYRFDLTNVVGASGNCWDNCGFDLGTQFSQIVSAELLVRGIFEPALPVEGVTWSVYLGDYPTGQVKAGLSLGIEGITGAFQERMSLGGYPAYESDTESEPLFLLGKPTTLSADMEDLAFLQDGLGVACATWFDASAHWTVDKTFLRFDEITLILNGVAVPEPTSLAMGALVLAASAGLRPCRAFLR